MYPTQNRITVYFIGCLIPHQFRLGPLLDGFDEARRHNVDMFAGAEFGTSSNTLELGSGSWHGDWECGSGRVVGQGVGAFFERQWDGAWCGVKVGRQLDNFRVYLLDCGRLQVLHGVFHAPHAGYGIRERLRFFGRMKEIWALCRRNIPKQLACCQGMSIYPAYSTKVACTRVGSNHSLPKHS